MNGKFVSDTEHDDYANTNKVTYLEIFFFGNFNIMVIKIYQISTLFFFLVNLTCLETYFLLCVDFHIQVWDLRWIFQSLQK